MRVLFTSVSGLGHVHPMVPLALALRDRGHDVNWLTGPDAVDRLRRIGIAAVAAGVPFDEVRAELRRRYPQTADLAPVDMPDHVFPRLFGEIATAHVVADAVGLAGAWRPDLVVNDAAEFAGPIAAASIGVPAVTHGFGDVTPRHRVADAAERVAPMWRSFGLEPRPYGGLYDHLYLDIYPASLRSWATDHIAHRQPLRPVPFDDAGDGSGWAPDTAADAPPLVYITLGTIFHDQAVLRAALEATTDLRVRVLVTVGPDGDPRALEPLPDNVQVERYVPQTRVFPHAALVVSHAGSGTFLAALGAGVPQLCLPQAADQFLNGAACERVGAGLTLLPGDATVATIADAVGRLLTDGSFRARARAMADEIAAMPSPSAVAGVLEGLSRAG